jgi:hypothetical protein
MNVSIICACKNREESLRISLQSWLCFDQIKEIIIVDWNSDKSLTHLTSIDNRIKVVRVDGEKYFNLSQPLNLASKFVTGDYILKLDCDYILNPYHSFFKNYSIDEKSFISGNHNTKSYEYWNGEGYGIDLASMHIVDIYNYVVTYTHYFKYLKGMLFVQRKTFEQIGGFNENIDSYGWEDSDIIHRLELFGLEHKKIDYDHSLIHIPHPDRKRFEHCKSYDPKDEENLKSQISSEVPEDRAQWEIEYVLSHKYIGENRQKFVELDTPYVKSKFQWEIHTKNEQFYIAQKISKLENISSVYYISLEESEDRQERIENQFSLYNIEVNSIISKRFAECDDKVTGPLVHILDDGTKGCVVSHLKMIEKWYNDTTEDYGFFCEDDLSLETIDYWNFTWKEFIDSLPNDWECIQLCCVRPDEIDIELRERTLYDWSVTAYILKRDYAKKILDRYCLEDSYHLEIRDTEFYPMPESVLFYGLGKVYSINLFVEDQNLKSTFTQINCLETGQKEYHTETYNHVVNWWKTNGKTANIIPKKIIPMKKYEDELQKLLTEFTLDPDNPETNFQLALWYEKENHTAPALSYFLRCAERTTDKDFAYAALIKGHYCYERQGTRDTTAKTLLQHALCLLPRRPEAYFLASRFHEKRQQWQDAYIYAHLGLETADFNQPELKSDVEYPGRYGLLFEKAISGYWWEKVDQSKEILLDLKNNYQMQDNYYQLVLSNLEKLGVSTEEIETKPIKITEDKMDIVLQGAYDEITDQIIREYINLPFVRNVIVSCWKDNKSNHYIDDRVEYIRNDYPAHFGTDNRNLQFLSSLSGLKRVKTLFSAKMRTDQKYDYASMMKMYGYFQEHKNSEIEFEFDSDKPKNKIFVAAVYPDLLFHPRDHIFWGNTSDLIDLFDIPLEIGGLSDKIKVGKDHLAKYYNFFTRSETYIGVHYCSNFDERLKICLLEPQKYLYDNAPSWNDVHEISKTLFPKIFKSFPGEGINLSWPKKNLDSYPYQDQKKYYNECWAEDGY